MLRGPQTAAELRTRSERLHPFLSLAEVERALGDLGERELVELLPRRPGQKEQRWAQLVGGGGRGAGSCRRRPPEPAPGLEQRVAELEGAGRAPESTARLD